MRQDLHQVVATVINSGRRDLPTRWGGKVRIVHDPEHTYENEFGGFRTCPINGKPIWRGRGGTASYRYLEAVIKANVGRLWDDVYSELCAVSKKDYYRNELRSFVKRTINTACYVGADGRVYEYSAGTWDDTYTTEYDHKTGKVTKVRKPGGAYHIVVDGPVIGFYVHPETGVLCYAENTRRYYQNDYVPPREPKAPEEINRIDCFDDGRRKAYYFDAARERRPYYWNPQYRALRDVSEWYALDEVGRSPRTKTKLWFHYKTTETITGEWKALESCDGKFATVPDHYTRSRCIWKMDFHPLRKFPDGRFDNELPVYVVWVWKEQRKQHTSKKSVNRKQMAEIRKIIAKELDRRKQTG